MSGYDFKKLKKFILIYRVVQMFILILMMVIAFQFQGALGMTIFIKVLGLSIALQLILSYPLIKGAGKEIEREIRASLKELSDEESKKLRNGRLFADMIKVAVFMFFFVSVMTLPEKLSQYPQVNRVILGGTIFSFLFTIMSYLQYLSFIGKKRIRELS